MMTEPREWQILKFLFRLVVALLLVLLAASTSSARMAVIETTTSLQNQSEQSVSAAFQEAARTAVRGVVAMGFAWVQLLEALVRDDMVVVRILATDSDPTAGAPEAYQVFFPSEFRFLPDCLILTAPVFTLNIPCESSL